jgi:CRP-like cAMP-binding protein
VPLVTERPLCSRLQCTGSDMTDASRDHRTSHFSSSPKAKVVGPVESLGQPRGRAIVGLSPAPAVPSFGLFGGQPASSVRRLDALVPLSDAGIASLVKAIGERVHRAGPGEDLISQGDRPDRIRIILSGWLMRQKSLADGRRQIVGFLLPGDTCDAQVHLLHQMDHSIGTLTPVVYADIDPVRFEELLKADRSLADAFQVETLVNAAILREWLINVGRRVALERVAHLFCEIFERLRAVGLLIGKSCAFPITQMDLADATGLSVVHVNRTIQELRANDLIVLRDRTLTINDMEALKSLALFSPNYLHLRGG